MKKSAQLKAQKADLLKQAQELLNQEQTDETRNQIDSLQKQAEGMDADIARAEAVESAVADAGKATGYNADGTDTAGEFSAFMAGTTTTLSDTVLAELDKQILILMQKTNPMRALATNVTTSSGIYEKLVSTSAIEANWVSETGVRNAGNSTTLEKVSITAGELFASVPYTKRVLDMSSFDLAAWAQAEVAKSFAAKERRAMFVDGTGADHQPIGLLTHVDTGSGVQKIDSIPSVSTGITAEELITLVYELDTEYLLGAAWVMARNTAKEVRLLKDGEGQFIWQESFQDGEPARLLGYPVQFVDEMPLLSESGKCSVIFGNINQAYTIVNHTTGTRMVRDELTAKPNVLLDTARYCGGNVVNGQAVKALKNK